MIRRKSRWPKARRKSKPQDRKLNSRYTPRSLIMFNLCFKSWFRQNQNGRKSHRNRLQTNVRWDGCIQIYQTKKCLTGFNRDRQRWATATQILSFWPIKMSLVMPWSSAQISTPKVSTLSHRHSNFQIPLITFASKLTKKRIPLQLSSPSPKLELKAIQSACSKSWEICHMLSKAKKSSYKDIWTNHCFSTA